MAEKKTKKAPEKVAESYKVKVTVPALNIRNSASMTAKVNGIITDEGEYTITETKSNFGKLENGKGWICLDFVKKV